jgi:hypothetical protein
MDLNDSDEDYDHTSRNKEESSESSFVEPSKRPSAENLLLERGEDHLVLQSRRLRLLNDFFEATRQRELIIQGTTCLPTVLHKCSPRETRQS